jgi:hypothetical protein
MWILNIRNDNAVKSTILGDGSGDQNQGAMHQGLKSALCLLTAHDSEDAIDGTCTSSAQQKLSYIVSQPWPILAQRTCTKGRWSEQSYNVKMQRILDAHGGKVPLVSAMPCARRLVSGPLDMLTGRDWSCPSEDGGKDTHLHLAMGRSTGQGGKLMAWSNRQDSGRTIESRGQPASYPQRRHLALERGDVVSGGAKRLGRSGTH